MLSEEQIRRIRRQVGNSPSDDDLEEIYGRLGDEDDVVAEILETRLADMRAQPASFDLAGVYGQNRASNIRSLESQLKTLKGASSGVVEFVQPDRRFKR